MKFTPDLFEFFRELRRNNNREWFAANKDRYVASVETPMLGFIREVGERLPAISPAFRADARRFGGSLYRIYRDTRFSADKSPYKPWIAARFKHRSVRGEVEGPGFYIHLGPTESFGGGGIYHPSMPTLTRIRQHIVDNPRAWTAVKKTGIEIEGESLVRAPAGFCSTHRFIEDLRRKDFYAGDDFSEPDVLSPRFIDRFMSSCQDVAPLVRLLTTALGLKY